MRAITFISARDAVHATPSHILEAAAILLCLVLVLLVLAIYRKAGRWTSRPRRTVPRVPGGPQLRVVQDAPPDMSNPVDQLAAVQRVGFEKTRLLNTEEAPLLPLLERIAREVGAGHRVMAQTSLGEVIRPARKKGNDRDARDAFASINSKRLDFAIIDRKGYLACAVEYQGSGHYQGNAVMRDTVKREVLRRAGVPFVEVSHQFDQEAVTQQIAHLLRPTAPGSEHRHSAVHM